MFPIQFTYEPNIPIGWSLRHSWLVSFLPQVLRSIYFPFPSQFLILNLKLLNDWDRKVSEPIGLIIAPSFSGLSAISFSWILLCWGAHIMITRYSFNCPISFSTMAGPKVMAERSGWTTYAIEQSTNELKIKLIQFPIEWARSEHASINSRWITSIWKEAGAFYSTHVRTTFIYEKYKRKIRRRLPFVTFVLKGVLRFLLFKIPTFTRYALAHSLGPFNE